jgi:threonine dehydratase
MATATTNGVSLAALESAARLVHGVLPPSPQIFWPLLSSRIGTEVSVKHENHLPTGAFKVRGGLVYLDQLRRRDPGVAGIVTATRGNHGQSLGFAARRAGMQAVVVVPHGNSRDKNAAMQSLGVELIEHGNDFQAAREHAELLAAERGLHLMPSWHPNLVQGVATYGLEWLRAVPQLHTVYVPIGMGSGICGMIAARNALGARTRIIGVVAQGAPAYALSFARREVQSTESAVSIADGIATRVPDPDALSIMLTGVDRMVTVSDAEIRQAMRWYFTDTHNVAEGAGAVALAALWQDRDRYQGKKVGVVLTGGNVDREVYLEVLREGGGGPSVED